ncbi:hypothetical protein GCM10027321_10020 [Massilia terrae]|uniref:DUF1640 domain-containing protein n=1 Tax=Massilia terrae TaxID=1811224 RepID=A0ABT2CZP0_9BURK|nr:hypothetical protein [Massilia terrae]MCS0659427.1 hypothetical protein [Massilia terrae]
MNELDERVANLEASSEHTGKRLLTLEHDVGLMRSQCASKLDLAEAKGEILVKVAETRAEIEGVEYRLRTEINGTENKLRTEINSSENKLRTEISGVEARLTIAINGVRQELRTEIAQAKNWLLFWVVTSVFLAQFLPGMLKKLGLF